MEQLLKPLVEVLHIQILVVLPKGIRGYHITRQGLEAIQEVERLAGVLPFLQSQAELGNVLVEHVVEFPDIGFREEGGNQRTPEMVVRVVDCRGHGLGRVKVRYPICIYFASRRNGHYKLHRSQGR